MTIRECPKFLHSSFGTPASPLLLDFYFLHNESRRKICVCAIEIPLVSELIEWQQSKRAEKEKLDWILCKKCLTFGVKRGCPPGH